MDHFHICYLFPGPTTPLEPFDKHAYYVVVPTYSGGYNVLGKKVNGASEIRKMYIDGSETDRYQIINDLYPNSTKVNEIKSILDSVLLTPKTITESFEEYPKIC